MRFIGRIEKKAEDEYELFGKTYPSFLAARRALNEARDRAHPVRKKVRKVEQNAGNPRSNS